MADFLLFQADFVISLKTNFDEVCRVRKKIKKQKVFVFVGSCMSHSLTAKIQLVWQSECPTIGGSRLCYDTE